MASHLSCINYLTAAQASFASATNLYTYAAQSASLLPINFSMFFELFLDYPTEVGKEKQISVMHASLYVTCCDKFAIKEKISSYAAIMLMNSRRACISRPAWNANILFNSMHDIERRNRAIRKHFYDLLGRGLPIMVAYAMTGQQFYLSEKRIRDIIAKRK